MDINTKPRLVCLFLALSEELYLAKSGKRLSSWLGSGQPLAHLSNARGPPRNLLAVAEIWGTLRHSNTSLKLYRSQNTFRKSFYPSAHLEFSFVPICLKYCGLSIAAKTERGGGGDTVRSPEIPVPALTLLQGHRISFRLSYNESVSRYAWTHGWYSN